MYQIGHDKRGRSHVLLLPISSPSKRLIYLIIENLSWFEWPFYKNNRFQNSISGRERERVGEEWSSCLHLHHLHYHATSTHHTTAHHTPKVLLQLQRQATAVAASSFKKQEWDASKPTNLWPEQNYLIFCANGFTRYQMIKDHSFPLIDM